MPEVRPLQPGDPPRLGDYPLVGRLGEGGQGVVYLGRGADGEQVAIKLLRAQLDRDSKAHTRFAREVSIAGRVAPFCTARVIGADLLGETPYIVSEYVEGASLLEAVRDKGPLSGAALDRLAVSTATALAAIHGAGIVHRDFKPGNVLLAADGPRVIDFGIARVLDATSTITSRVVGTPAFMSPEQVNDEEVGPAADMFAWASTIVYAATGASPFGGSTIPAILNRIVNHEPDLDALGEPLRRVVAAALSKDPGKRPTPREVLDHMVGAASAVTAGRGGPVPAAEPGARTPGDAAPAASAAASPSPGQAATARLEPASGTSPWTAPAMRRPSPMLPFRELVGPGLGALVGMYLLGLAVWPGWTAHLQRDLHLTTSAMVAVSAAYLVAAVLGAPAGAVLGRRSPNAVAVAAAGLMLLGVVVDAMAPDHVLLATGQVVAGLGAGALGAEAMVLALRAGRRMAYAVGGLGALALVLGPALGVAVAVTTTWRLVFLIAIPPLAVAGLASIIAAVSAVAGRPANS